MFAFHVYKDVLGADKPQAWSYGSMRYLCHPSAQITIFNVSDTGSFVCFHMFVPRVSGRAVDLGKASMAQPRKWEERKLTDIYGRP